MVLKNKFKNLEKIIENKEKQRAENKASEKNTIKRKIKRAISIGLIIADIATPALAATPEKEKIDASRIETYHIVERLERNGETDTLQQYAEKINSDEEANFVNLLESESIFVLNTETVPDEKTGTLKQSITGIDKVIDSDGIAELEEIEGSETKIVYAKESAFEKSQSTLPKGYKKCVNLDYIQDLDEEVLKDIDYIHISPKYNSNTAETKEFYTKEDYLRVMDVVHELTQNIKDDDNDFVKMAKIYLGVIDYMNYDYDSFAEGYDRDSKSGNLLALLDELGVCTAYTDSVYNLAKYKGVDCKANVGQTDKSGHSWNVFYYTDKYGEKHCYGVDATFGEGNMKKMRNNFASNIFENTHSDYYTAGIPLAYSENATRSDSGFGNQFIEEFLGLVQNDINIRPETFQEMKNHGITSDDLITTKNNHPELFREPVEVQEDMIIQEASRYKVSKSNPDLEVQLITPNENTESRQNNSMEIQLHNPPEDNDFER